jgi:hypothetical protein
MATLKDFLRKTGNAVGRTVLATNPSLQSVVGGLNMANKFLNRNSNTGATSPQPVTNNLPSNSPGTQPNNFNQNVGQSNTSRPSPFGTTGNSVRQSATTLPPEGRQFLSTLNQPSTSEFSFNEVQTPRKTIVQSENTQPVETQQQDPYLNYINSILGSDTLINAQKQSQADLNRLADIRNRQEKERVRVRRGIETELDREGGLRSGAQQAAQQFSRRENQNLADIALQESAAARSADVSSQNFQNLLGLGKEAFEANQTESPEGFTLGENQTRFDAQGNIIAQGTGTQDVQDTSSVSAFADAISKNQAKLSDVPQDLRGAVLAQVNATKGESVTPKQQRALQQSEIALSTLDEIFNNPALERGALNRTAFGLIPGTESKDLKKSIASIQALVGFDELQKMRDASPTGGALGQVSEREIDFLQSLKGSIDTTQSDEQLTKNLERIQKSFQILQLTSSPNGSVGQIQGFDFIKQGDNLITETPQGTFRLNERGNLEPFSSVGSDTNIASKVADAISQVESGGKQVKGASGEFGAFQFMPATWETISKQVAGQVIPQTPENERAVAEGKIAQLLAQGNTPEEVALIWNTSLGGAEKPFVRKGVNSKGVAYDSGAYAKKVVNTLNKLA